MSGYDAIVVGARCAGSPTAMLLARKGYRVLVVDQATFPSDTISTHLIHPPGVSALTDWGLLDRLTATGCPGIDTYAYDVGPFTISGSPGTDESPVAYAPRRTVLDALLVDAAADAGAEIRQGFTVTDVVIENGRVTGIRGHRKGESTITERARVVVGADGHHSFVARSVKPQAYNEKPELQVSYYTYMSGLPMDGRFEVYLRPDRGFAAWPTNDDLTVVIGGWPRSEFTTNRKDFETAFLATLELAPEFAARFRTAEREARFVGMSVANFLRKPFGPGWTLVGDAGYTLITGSDHDAFRDAGLCATALDSSPARVRSTTRWPPINPSAIGTRSRSTSSPPSLRPCSRSRRSSSACWTLSTATRTRWMRSRASAARSRPRRSSSASGRRSAGYRSRRSRSCPKQRARESGSKSGAGAQR